MNTIFQETFAYQTFVILEKWALMHIEQFKDDKSVGLHIITEVQSIFFQIKRASMWLVQKSTSRKYQNLRTTM